MNIYKKIAAVQKVCTGVKKDTRVQNQYNALSHDGVLEYVRQAVIDNGIVVLVSQQAKGFCHDGETKSGTYQVRFEAVYDVTFVNIEDPEDRVTVSVEGHGEDFNDKGPGKAISYATKTAFLKTFLLVTQENDELRTGEGAPRKQQNNPQGNNSDKPWFNDFSKHKADMVSRIASGEQTAQQIIDSLSDKYKLSKKTKEDILALETSSQLPADDGDTY